MEKLVVTLRTCRTKSSYFHGPRQSKKWNLCVRPRMEGYKVDKHYKRQMRQWKRLNWKTIQTCSIQKDKGSEKATDLNNGPTILLFQAPSNCLKQIFQVHMAVASCHNGTRIHNGLNSSRNLESDNDQYSHTSRECTAQWPIT